LRHWQKDDIFAICKGMAETLDIKPKDLFATLFVVITGTTNSVSVFDAMENLGPDMSRARIRHAIELLGGLSKKEAKRWDKEYQAL
jgi:glutamyl-tRNA synthetase